MVAVPCGIAIPQMFVDGPVDMDLVHRFVARAESLGYHSLWVQDHIIGGPPSLEPIGLLCNVAAVTNTIRLGTSVIVTTTRNPTLLAKQISTLDSMSNGRLIIGLALGGRPGQYALLGGPSDRRVRHFEEGLRVMKALWHQSPASFTGQFWKVDGEAVSPQPVQQPHPPVWFGGRHSDALKRAVRLGDGWMGAGSTTTEEFKGHVGVLRETLAHAGRDPSTFAISKRVYIALDDDEDRAEGRLRHWFGQVYGNADMAPRVSVWGSASRCVEGLSEVVGGGAEMLMLNPVVDHMETMEALSDTIIPQLERR